MGAGLIGCEFANDLAASGYKVSVADPSQGPMSALLPEAASLQLRDALASLGVTWHFGTTVKAVNYAPAGGPGEAPKLTVALSNGQLETADIVLSAIGLRANTVLAQAAGLQCERGIVVDDTLQTSAQHIFALGDGAQYAQGQWASGAALTGGRSMPYVMPIMQQARALAKTLNGETTAVHYPAMPVAVKTPAAPLTVLPAPIDAEVNWETEELDDGMIAKALDSQGTLRGFVLLGATAAKQRLALTKLVPDLIPAQV